MSNYQAKTLSSTHYIQDKNNPSISAQVIIDHQEKLVTINLAPIDVINDDLNHQQKLLIYQNLLLSITDFVDDFFLNEKYMYRFVDDENQKQSQKQ